MNKYSTHHMLQSTNGDDTVKNLIHTVSRMLQYHTDVPMLEAHVLVSHVLGFTQKELICNADTTVHDEHRKRVLACATTRVSGVPIAYITGKKEFYGRSFLVNSDVLIPRPETEQLVDEVLSLINTLPSNVQHTIVDVGTGSGCIGITLALELQRENKLWDIALIDTSSVALHTAHANVRVLLGENCRCSLYFGDAIHGLRGLQWYALQGSASRAMHPSAGGVIVANLPYVAPHEYRYAYGNISYEPRNALVGTHAGRGMDGLYIIRKFLQAISKDYCIDKKPIPHCVALEVDPFQIDSVIREAGACRYPIVQVIHDIRGYPRICVCIAK